MSASVESSVENGSIRSQTRSGASMMKTLGWGLYCTSSWTWCIGMFLPIVMLRRFGWPGFLVFAIPNIIGLVAFGYLFDVEKARKALQRHRVAMRLFSIATAAFQLFFVTWMALRLELPGGTNTAVGIGLGAWLIALATVRFSDAVWWKLGSVVWICSITLFVLHLMQSGPGELARRPMSGAVPGLDLIALAPAIVFGFLLCPWLDGSFHRARIRSASPHTFMVFGATFIPMILFTCTYAIGGDILLERLVLIQLALQATFTTGVHLKEAWTGGCDVEAGDDGGAMTEQVAARRWRFALWVPGLAIPLGALALTADLSTYLRFLGFYGLAFPAYVLFFMIVRAGRAPGVRQWLMFLLLMFPAGIAFDVGFIGDQPLAIPFTISLLMLLGAVFWIINVENQAQELENG